MQELEKILEEIKDELKDIYLDIANNYNISDLQYDGDKVACVASKFRCDAGRRIEKIIRKHMNDGWIPVEERLPEDNIEVLITYADMEDEKETGIAITTYGYATLGGKKLYFKEWRSPFLYFKGNYKVIAWRPLPEPYRPERSNEHDGE